MHEIWIEVCRLCLPYPHPETEAYLGFLDFRPQTTGQQALQFGNPDLQCGTLHALQKKNIALWGYPETPNEEQRGTHFGCTPNI